MQPWTIKRLLVTLGISAALWAVLATACLMLGTSGTGHFPSVHSEVFREGDRFEHGFGFVDGFLIFAFGRGIVHPAPAEDNFRQGTVLDRVEQPAALVELE